MCNIVFLLTNLDCLVSQFLGQMWSNELKSMRHLSKSQNSTKIHQSLALGCWQKEVLFLPPIFSLADHRFRYRKSFEPNRVLIGLSLDSTSFLLQAQSSLEKRWCLNFTAAIKLWATYDGVNFINTHFLGFLIFVLPKLKVSLRLANKRWVYSVCTLNPTKSANT